MFLSWRRCRPDAAIVAQEQEVRNETNPSRDGQLVGRNLGANRVTPIAVRLTDTPKSSADIYFPSAEIRFTLW